MARSEIRVCVMFTPGFRGACHRARIRATRWLHPGYSAKRAGKSARLPLRFANRATDQVKGNPMSNPGKKNEPAEKADDKSKKPPPPPVQDDDEEDGDIATPKRDRDGADDEPL
jgi:hypothetical protein